MIGGEERHGDPEGIASLVRIDAHAHRPFRLLGSPRSQVRSGKQIGGKSGGQSW
jgi:hypothetical protein